MNTQPQTPAAPELSPPEVLTPVPRQSAGELVPVKEERKAELERWAEAYILDLLSADLGSARLSCLTPFPPFP